MNLRLIIPFAFISLSCWCCTGDEAKTPVYEIEFLVIDEITGLPVKDTKIRLLEEGRTVKTTKKGVAGFTKKDLASASIQSITDSIAYAFSIIHPDFRPREINASLGLKTIKLLTDSTGTYHYQKPVQVDDGLDVGTLADAGLNAANIQQLMDKIAKPGYRDLHSILIYKEGKLVLEEYYYGNHDTINLKVE